MTCTAAELSVICPAGAVPADVRHERGWRRLEAEGPFDLAATGILASLAGPLAAAGVSTLAVATFDTDHLLVPGARLPAALAALRAAGHTVRT